MSLKKLFTRMKCEEGNIPTISIIIFKNKDKIKTNIRENVNRNHEKVNSFEENACVQSS